MSAPLPPSAAEDEALVAAVNTHLEALRKEYPSFSGIPNVRSLDEMMNDSRYLEIIKQLKAFREAELGVTESAPVAESAPAPSDGA